MIATGQNYGRTLNNSGGKQPRSWETPNPSPNGGGGNGKSTSWRNTNRFDSVEVKPLSFRLDGVFLLQNNNPRFYRNTKSVEYR